MSIPSLIPHARSLFTLAPDEINLASMAIGAVPEPVRTAVRVARDQLDAAPWRHLRATLGSAEKAVCQAASTYFGVRDDCVALTTGTTMGLALLYGGLRLLPGQEILTTLHEFAGVHQILDWRQQRLGTPVRRIPLLMDPAHATADGVLATLAAALRPTTRVLALTWVYSNTGVKLPMPRIGQWLATVNATRPPAERVLLCVDGVHGFGVEQATFDGLGCAAFVAGCHKWVCGPRGTGIWCATPEAWAEVLPQVPTSSNTSVLGLSFSPGGVQAYEHLWGMAAAFAFLGSVGPAAIEQHIHGLATAAKQALVALPKVEVITPMDDACSAGIVCFDVDGMAAADVVQALEARGILTTVSSSDAGRPAARHARVSLAMFNTPDEVEALVAAVASL